MIPFMFFPPNIETTSYANPPVLSRFMDQRATSALVDPYIFQEPMGIEPASADWVWEDRVPLSPAARAQGRLKVRRIVQLKIEAAPGEFTFDDEDDDT